MDGPFENNEICNMGSALSSGRPKTNLSTVFWRPLYLEIPFFEIAVTHNDYQIGKSRHPILQSIVGKYTLDEMDIYLRYSMPMMSTRSMVIGPTSELVKYYNDLLGRQSSELGGDEVTYFLKHIFVSLKLSNVQSLT